MRTYGELALATDTEIKYSVSMKDWYTQKDLVEITELKPFQIAFYTREGITAEVADNEGKGRERKYSPRNLFQFLLISELLRYGMPIAAVKKILMDLNAPKNERQMPLFEFPADPEAIFDPSTPMPIIKVSPLSNGKFKVETMEGQLGVVAYAKEPIATRGDLSSCRSILLIDMNAIYSAAQTRLKSV